MDKPPPRQKASADKTNAMAARRRRRRRRSRPLVKCAQGFSVGFARARPMNQPFEDITSSGLWLGMPPRIRGTPQRLLLTRPVFQDLPDRWHNLKPFAVQGCSAHPLLRLFHARRPAPQRLPASPRNGQGWIQPWPAGRDCPEGAPMRQLAGQCLPPCSHGRSAVGGASYWQRWRSTSAGDLDRTDVCT